MPSLSVSIKSNLKSLTIMASAPKTPQTSTGNVVPSQTKSKKRLAVIGIGNLPSHAVKCLTSSETWRVTAAYEQNSHKRQELKTLFPRIHWFRSLTDLKRSCAGLDIPFRSVYIATAEEEIVEDIPKVLSAGIDVLVDQSVVLHNVSICHCQKTATKSGSRFTIAIPTRYGSRMHRVKAMHTSHHIGKLTSIDSTLHLKHGDFRRRSDENRQLAARRALCTLGWPLADTLYSVFPALHVPDPSTIHLHESHTHGEIASVSLLIRPYDVDTTVRCHFKICMDGASNPHEINLHGQHGRIRSRGDTVEMIASKPHKASKEFSFTCDPAKPEDFTAMMDAFAKNIDSSSHTLAANLDRMQDLSVAATVDEISRDHKERQVRFAKDVKVIGYSSGVGHRD